MATLPYVTKSLLDSWIYATEHDKLEDLINQINRVPIPDNDNFRRGREFEAKVCDGNDEVFSPIVQGGLFQVGFVKTIQASEPVKIYGILDVLKAGHIYDIKSTTRYEVGKYYHSTQHLIYLEMVQDAKDFTYLVECNGNYYTETYTRQECCYDLVTIINQFIDWLKLNNLYETWKEKFKK